MLESQLAGCGPLHLHRRTLLRAAGWSGVSWMTPVARLLSRASEARPQEQPAQSVILLWMAGGPSQLDTFDPKPGTAIGGTTRSRSTNAAGVEIAQGLEQIADWMHRLSLVRSVVSKEGDHERATYAIKTGYRPDPTLVHPAIGAIICHQLQDEVEIPRHVSILPGQWPARGGYLGAQFDAFKVYDPQGSIPDVTAPVSQDRFQQRIADLAVVEAEFARGRLRRMDEDRTLSRSTTQAAVRMMSSEQLQAFDIQQEPIAVRRAFGDTPFGRGCLAAARLIDVGVRCVEVTLGGWDSHVNNQETQAERIRELDPAFASLLRYLDEHQRLDSTVVLWGGEFGRTPRINPAGGRDHWPHGFTIALAGGRIARGRVIGETSPEPREDGKDWTDHLRHPRPIGDIHATVLMALGIRHDHEMITPIGRPMAFTEGNPIRELLTS
ncbi:MAG: DUF1501 domain-containing protein [Pirellulaceae bacterium]